MRCETSVWRVLSANSPTGCSAKSARHHSRLRARRGGPVRGHPPELTGTFALAATATQAQSIAQHGQSQERQDASDEHGKQGRPWAIVGSWFGTTATGIRQLITFHADGTVLRSVPGEVSTDPARPPHTAAHGVWRYLGKGRFGVTVWDLFYDVNTAQPHRYNKLRLELTLADDRDTASATAIVETIDRQGVVVGSRTGSANFVRIPFEPLE